MMKIDKAPVPLIVPNPDDPRLTERVTGTDQTGAAVHIRVPVERPLTLYLNAREIVTMMTIGGTIRNIWRSWCSPTRTC